MSERAPHEDDRSLLDQTLYLASRIYNVPNTPAIPIDLHSACAIGSYMYQTVKDAIDSGTDFNSRNKAGWTPLMYASYVGHDTVVNLLLDSGAEPSRGTPSGLTPLMVAAGCGNESVCYFLLQAGAEIDSQDSNGYTALVHGVRQGHQIAVQLLLEAGADLELPDKEHGYTALMQASIEGDEIIVDVLVACDANLNAKDNCGETACSLAYKHHQVRTATLLDNAIFMFDNAGQMPDNYDSSDDDLFTGRKDLEAFQKSQLVKKNIQEMPHDYIAARRGSAPSELDSKPRRRLLRAALSMPERDGVLPPSDEEEGDISVSEYEAKIKGLNQQVVKLSARNSQLERKVENLLRENESILEMIESSSDIRRLSKLSKTKSKKFHMSKKYLSKFKKLSKQSGPESPSGVENRSINDSGYQSLPSVSSQRVHVPGGPQGVWSVRELRRVLELQQSSAADPAPIATGRLSTTTHQVLLQRQPFEEKQEFTLPGVEVAGRVTVKVTNSAHSFSWDDHGLKLHIPQGSLPAGLPHCTLNIISSLAGHYLSPDNMELLSPVYWVKPTPFCKFLKPLTLEIQHWAKVSCLVELMFLRANCSQKALPYVFKEVREKGSFSDHSSFGVLEVYSFSGYSIGGKSKSADRIEKFYFASFYDRQVNHWTTEIYFIIALDQKVYRKKVKKHFQKLKATHKSTLEIEFESDKICLDIPIEGVRVSEWTLRPQSSPLEILRRRVERAGTHSEFPCRQLTATLPPEYPSSIPACAYPINLKGARSLKQLNISLNVFIPTVKPTVDRDHQSVSAVRASACSDMALALSLPGAISHSYNTLPSIPEISALVPQSRRVVPLPASYYHQQQPLPYPLHLQDISPKAISISIEQLIDSIGISRELLDREVSDQHIMELAALLPNWQACASHLGLTDHEVQDLHDKSWADNTTKSQELLKKWHKKLVFNAKYLTLVELCLNLGYGTSAKRICQLLESSD